MEGATLQVEENSGYRLVGKIAIVGRTSNFIFTAKFIDYRETWRKAVCYWQAPLEWVSLGLWSIVPLSYPCFPSQPYLSKNELIVDVQNAAKAAGADVVVLTYEREHNEKLRGGTGWLLKQVTPSSTKLRLGKE